MATLTPSTSLKNNILDTINTALNAGGQGASIKIYTGTKPTGPDTAISTQTLLGTLTCSYPAGTVSAGSLTFGAVTQDSAADATGTATWLRMSDSGGTAVIDMDITTIGGGGFAQMNTTSVVQNGPITAPSIVITA